MPLKKTTVGWADYTWELPQTGRDSPQWAGALRSPLEMTVPKRILLDANPHLFCDRVPDEQVREIWALMRDTLRHTFLVLTDSPDVMAKTTKRLFLDSRTDGLRNRIHPNIWLGVRVDGQDTADSRIPQLYAIDCDVRVCGRAEPAGYDRPGNATHGRAFRPSRTTTKNTLYTRWSATSTVTSTVTEEWPPTVYHSHGWCSRMPRRNTRSRHSL